MIKNKFICIILILILSTIEKNYAQSDPNISLYNKLGLSFHTPDGFKFYQRELNESTHFVYGCGLTFNPIFSKQYYYANEDKSIMITYEVFPITANRGDNIFTLYHVDDNSDIFIFPRMYADTLNDSLRFYPAQKLNHIGVDRIVTYNHRCKLSRTDYVAKMTKSFLKYDKFQVNITYLTKPHVKSISDVIKNTENMLTYTFKDEIKPDLNYFRNRYHIQIDDIMKKKLLDYPWQKGLVYNDLWYFNGEYCAFQVDSAIVSLQFIKNKWWPFTTIAAKERNLINTKPNDWDKGNLDFLKYLKPSNGTYEKVSDLLVAKLNADEAYSFDFLHADNDLYRDEYKKCRVLLIHKKNVGSYLLRYYYKDKDKIRIKEIIENLWGKIAFRDKYYFAEKGDNIIPF